MNTSSLAESMCVLAKVSPQHEPQFIYEMLLQAVSSPESVRVSTVTSVVQIVVERRLLGIIEDLADYEAWTLHQVALGEINLIQEAEAASLQLTTLLLPTTGTEMQAYLNLGMAVTYLWALYDTVYDTIAEAVYEQTDSGPLLHRSNPYDGDTT